MVRGIKKSVRLAKAIKSRALVTDEASKSVIAKKQTMSGRSSLQMPVVRVLKYMKKGGYAGRFHILLEFSLPLCLNIRQLKFWK
jgi:hypothetical protein